MHCTAKTDAKSRAQCLPNFEDYMECLHHTKEKARLREIESVLKQKKEGLEAPRQGHPRQGHWSCRGVGITKEID